MSDQGKHRSRRSRQLRRYLLEAALTLSTLQGQDLEDLVGEILLAVAVRTVTAILLQECPISIRWRNKKHPGLNSSWGPTSTELEGS